MRNIRPLILALAALPLLGGCIARAAISVVTLPVKATSKAVDMVTTSQSEADEKRGRALRKDEERLGKLDRDYRRHAEKCARGDDEACERGDAEMAEMEQLRRILPAEY